MDSRDYRNGVPVGFPGRISRLANLATEAHRVDDAAPPSVYGLAVGISAAGDVAELPASSAADAVFGFLVAPEFSTYTEKPEPGRMGDVMRQGYMTVKVASGTVTANGAVYIRVGNASDSHPLGEINAAAVTETSLRTVVLPGARFTGPSTAASDGSCIAEIAFNL
ncbi:MAG: hypothetical protein LBL73_07060 [Synergistaceae bacterium]|jgi:hypothetical protein|nr:hypothetical protein [Synergistaceae bacterium]